MKNVKRFDKTLDKQSMNDFMMKNPAHMNVPILNVRPEGQILKYGKNSPFNVISEEKVQERRDYNDTKIFNILEMYHQFSPAQNILVRVFARNFTKFLDTWQDYSPKIPVFTKNQKGILKHAQDPYSFGLKAVIVSVPETAYDTRIKPGDIVQIHGIDTTAPIPGDDNFLIPNHYFIHADTPNVRHFDAPPKDITNPEYGYFLLPAQNILGKLDYAELNIV